MVLPDGFQFSQASLQDYVDCPRRFELRALLRLAWPALEADPALENERALQQGAAFHRLAHQHALGIAPQHLPQGAGGADLRRWWRNYLERGPQDLPVARYPEAVLSAPLGGYRLVAKMDLVAVQPGERAVIVDWKTSPRRTGPERLAGRLQTKVYPYLLVQAGAHLNGGQPVAPEQVEMIYWFAEFPNDPARFAYDAARYEADGAGLLALVAEIAALGEGDFPLTTRPERCKYCRYRSLCGRGVEAGEFGEVESEPGEESVEIALDFEQIAEIEY